MRTLMAGFTAIVKTTFDNADVASLRTAIEEVDTEGSATQVNSIIFNIPTTDSGYDPTTKTFTSDLTSELPPVTVPVTIDGTSESVFLGGTASIDIDGSGITGSADGLTLANGSDGSTIDGLGVLDFSGSGIVVQTSDNTIGGTAAGAGNTLGHDTAAGVSISGAAASGNVLLGNFIGADSIGDILPNGVGVILESADNTIGGAATGAGNEFEFNSSAGVSISGASATANLVAGDGFQQDNVGVIVNAGNNTVGGTASGAGNFFVDNSMVGVSISGASNVLLGNTIGYEDAGNGVGVIVTGAGNTIGGTATGALNFIDDNSSAGVSISGASATANLVIGDSMENEDVGVILESADNTIGGTVSGATNFIDENSTAGVSISGASGTSNLVAGNDITDDASVGVSISVGSSSNLVMDNTIESDDLAGVSISGAANVLLTNVFVGSNVGVMIDSADNTIGGTAAGAGNVIGSCTAAGVSISGASNVLLGNSIESDPVGVIVESAGNTIGGVAAGAGNTISEMTAAGVSISGTSATANVLLGNIIGTNPGSGGVEGDDVGVVVNSGNNTIGGTATGAGNVIGFNATAGVSISGVSASSNVVIGNFIGTALGDADQGNGIGVIVNAPGNTIGGTNPGEGNLIGFNTTAGISITNASGAGDVVLGNLIGADGLADVGNAVGVEVELCVQHDRWDRRRGGERHRFQHVRRRVNLGPGGLRECHARQLHRHRFGR